MNRSLLRTLALCLVIATYNRASDAMCLAETTEVLNADRPIALNGRVVVRGFSKARPLLDELVRSRIELRSGSDIVTATVVDRRVGDRDEVQVVLAPARQLLPDRSYRIAFDRLPGSSSLEARTAKATDTTPPRWRAVPNVTERFRTQKGCGPTVDVIFAANVDDDGGYLLAHVEVTRVRDGFVSRGYVPVVDGRIRVGHAMCSGLFGLERGASYDVRIAAVDSAGNEAIGTPTPIRVIAP